MPRHRRLASELIRARLLLTEALWHTGQTEQARQQVAAAEATLQQVGEVEGDAIEWHLRSRGGVLLWRVRLDPDPPKAAAQQVEALQDYAELIARQGSQGRPPLREGLLNDALALLRTLGDARMAQGDAAAARQHWQAVVRQALPEAQQGSHRPMHELALALLRLEEPEQARAWLARLQASTWRHPDLAVLQRQLGPARPAPQLASAR
jgi:hypothetical protein